MGTDFKSVPVWAKSLTSDTEFLSCVERIVIAKRDINVSIPFCLPAQQCCQVLPEQKAAPSALPLDFIKPLYLSSHVHVSFPANRIPRNSPDPQKTGLPLKYADGYRGQPSAQCAIFFRRFNLCLPRNSARLQRYAATVMAARCGAAVGLQ